jgi:hypothetical protein
MVVSGIMLIGTVLTSIIRASREGDGPVIGFESDLRAVERRRRA